MKEASFYRNAAWQQLSKQWGPAVVFTLVFFAVSCVASVIDGIFLSTGIVSILLLSPVQYSYHVQLLENTRCGKELKVETLFDYFSDYSRIVGTHILMYIYIFLWSLLLIIPGIIKSISYSQVAYILYDDPSLAYDKAIERSMAMMDGHKWEYFWLGLTFIGWYLLAILTLGIGFLWVNPYVSKTCALFYEDLKREYEGKATA